MSVVIRNSAIVGNTGGDGFFSPGQASTDGAPGAIQAFIPGLTIIGSVIARNTPGQPGLGAPPTTGGIEYRGTGPLTINSIIYDNVGPSFMGRNLVRFDPRVYYSNVENLVGFMTPEGYFGAGNIDTDPLFVDPANGDYRLSPNSPCIDAGLTALTNLPLVDIAGRPRLLGTEIDMGAYEFNPELAGTPDGLDLSTTVDGTGSGIEIKHAPSGAAVVAELLGTAPLTGAQPILLGQVFITNSAPAGMPSIPLWLDPLRLVVLHDGATMPSPPVQTTPIAFAPFLVPTGLEGLTLRLQAATFSTAAINGAYAMSGAEDLVFLN